MTTPPRDIRGAVSLTFDDGLPCQRAHALPAMREAGIQGTFYVIQNSPFEASFVKKEWVEASRDGHEIGSHSVNHRKAAELNLRECGSETRDSREFLEREIGQPVTSFAYPYTDAPRQLQEAVKRAGYECARGGRAAVKGAKDIVRGQGFNRFCVPSFHVSEATFEHGVLFALIDAVLERGSWLTLMFHGIGEPGSWENVEVGTFNRLLGFLREAKTRGLWVAPFSEVCRAWK